MKDDVVELKGPQAQRIAGLEPATAGSSPRR